MTWALEEFFAAVGEEFGLQPGDDALAYLDTPRAVIDFIVDQTSASDGMTEEEHRDHVASVVGEIMARTLGITRYREDSRFVEDLHAR